MKKSKKIILGLIVIIVVFISGMFFASRKTEPTITSTLIQNSIEQASDLVTTKYHYSKVGKFENSLDLNGWTIPLTNKNFILTFEGEIQIGTNLSNAKVKIEDKKIIVNLDSVEVLSNTIDEESIEIYDETKNIFNPISVSDYKEFAIKQKKVALKEAKEKGLMKEAKENTQKSIKQLIQMIPEANDYTIEINIED